MSCGRQGTVDVAGDPHSPGRSNGIGSNLPEELVVLVVLVREIMRRRLLSIGLLCATLTTCSKSEPSLPSAAPSLAGFTVSGHVYEQLPNKARGAALAGVRIETRGAKVPETGTTDQEGHFSLSDVAGAVDLALSKDGYQPNVVSLGTLQKDVTVDATLSTPTLTLAGVVTETPPTEHTPVAGTTVRIASGPAAGLQAVTDGNGYFSIPGVWGEFDVSVAHPDYETQVLHTSASQTVTTLHVALMPDGIVRSEFSGRLCADTIFYFGVTGRIADTGDPNYLCLPSDPVVQRHVFAIHRSGTLMVGLDWQYKDDYSNEYMHLGVQCGSSGADQLWIKQFESAPPVGADNDPTQRMPPNWRNPRPQPLQVSVIGPSTCEVKPFAYFSFKSSEFTKVTQYRLTIDHPR